MSEAFIFDAVRTPRGKGRPDGSLYEVSAVRLLEGLLVELLRRNNFDTKEVDDILIGCAQPHSEQGQVLGRMAALAAGWHWRVPGLQLNRYCGSGLEAITLAAQKVRSGWQDLLVAGGVESMSRIPMGQLSTPKDHNPSLFFELSSIPQGLSADVLATLDGRSRESLDRVALASQSRAATAQQEGRFCRSLVPVRDLNGAVLLDRDELVRVGTKLEDLAKLKPSFQDMGDLGFDAMAIAKYPQLQRVEHSHTAGNSSGIVDAASALLIGSEEKGRALGLTPRARIVSAASIGDEPTIMLSAPGPASKLALEKAGLKTKDIDLFEVNEAFASVVLRFQDDMGVDLDRINVNGGAIALGHPLGATGGVLVATLLDELERRGDKRGLATLCAADGMGVALIIERV